MERDCAEVFPAALAERDGMAIDFLIAEDEHIRNFLALGVADLRVHAVRTSVDMHSQPGIAQLGGNFISSLDMAIGDRDDFGLDSASPSSPSPALGRFAMRSGARLILMQRSGGSLPRR